jgi:catechol 2,3-dioxygenase-like lactoylglutathione lyase family enzyme
MSPIRHFDHVGITVRDLDTVMAFFAGLGLEAEGRTVLEGEFLDTVIGMPGSRTADLPFRRGRDRLSGDPGCRPERRLGARSPPPGPSLSVAFYRRSRCGVTRPWRSWWARRPSML